MKRGTYEDAAFQISAVVLGFVQGCSGSVFVYGSKVRELGGSDGVGLGEVVVVVFFEVNSECYDATIRQIGIRQEGDEREGEPQEERGRDQLLVRSFRSKSL
jgi:hypothetical protein